jgi:hypothetical protein
VAHENRSAVCADVTGACSGSTVAAGAGDDRGGPAAVEECPGGGAALFPQDSAECESPDRGVPAKSQPLIPAAQPDDAQLAAEE